MATIDKVRTTAFRLSDAHFGVVHAYRAGPRFTAAWEQLRSAWERRGGTPRAGYLPYGSLAAALRIATGDFVAMQRRLENEQALVVSRKPLDLSLLAIALEAWEVHALGSENRPVSAHVDDIHVEQLEVASLIRRRSGKSPTLAGGRWPWDVAIWEVAHRLAATALHTDVQEVSLRLDSDAALLTWDHLIRRDPTASAVAMHKIVPHLITIPGVEAPVVSFESSLVRLASTWAESKGSRTAWADIDPSAPVLRARVYHRRKDGGGFAAEWTDHAVDVLRALSLHPLPDVATDPSGEGPLRCGFKKQPTHYPVGKGVGTWFHECVAHHARRALGPDAEAVELQSQKVRWPSRDRAAPRTWIASAPSEGGVRLRILVAYATSEVRRRVRDALPRVLAQDDDRPRLAAALAALDDGDALRSGDVEIRFVRPPAADVMLLHPTLRPQLVEWLREWCPQRTSDGSVLGAIVETAMSARNEDDELADPKDVLRVELARRGMATQFIVAESAPAVRRASRNCDGATSCVVPEQAHDPALRRPWLSKHLSVPARPIRRPARAVDDHQRDGCRQDASSRAGGAAPGRPQRVGGRSFARVSH